MHGVLTMLQHPRTVMTFSDAGAHVSQIISASLQTYLLSHWVREVGAFSIEEAVRMITLVPSSIWGLADRRSLRAVAGAFLFSAHPDSDLVVAGVDDPAADDAALDRVRDWIRGRRAASVTVDEVAFPGVVRERQGLISKANLRPQFVEGL